MTLNLPTPVAAAVQPLFEALPLDRAMAQLVVASPAPRELIELAKTIAADPALASRPALGAGLWLYVDDLDRSHAISQNLDNPTGSFWHGILHRREGDFSNSHYWFRRAGRHPAMTRIEDYDGHAFIDEVEAAHQRGQAPAALIQRQRREWARLFEWCCEQCG